MILAPRTRFLTPARRRAGEAGVSLIELVLAASLVAVMAGLALPVAHTMERRARELELRGTLRQMRRAIDAYRFTVQAVPTAHKDATAEDWPKELEVLVEGIDLGLAKETKAKFLRRIPRDPMTGKTEWGLRSSKQDPDDTLWDGVNVFDVYSLAEGKALDGTLYSEW